MSNIEIVDRGRGPQLSTCRITVQDLVPYLQRNCTYDAIREIMPVLTTAEIQAVERYVHDHFDAIMEEDQRIRERTNNQVRLQKSRFPPEDSTIRQARMREQLHRRRQGKNGDSTPE